MPPLPDPYRGQPATDAMAVEEAEARALLHLVRCAAPLGAVRTLLERHGGAVAALDAGAAAWREAGMDAQSIGDLRAAPRAEPTFDAWIAAPGRAVIGWHHPDYPPALREAASPPAALFVEGDASLLWRPAIAVVGTRQPSPGGRDNAADFARAFARAGFLVASGMAAGIDTAAHHAALEAGAPTLAVLGTGPDLAYPRENAALRDAIAARGVLVSEHPPGTGAQRQHFPSRNRIIAALALGTVVVEAAARSGALITARQAGEAGREVFAVPGSIHNPMARGCHRLIRDGATLVETPAEVIDALAGVAARWAGQLRLQLATSDPTCVPDAEPAGPRRPAPALPPAPAPTPFPDDPDSHILWQALGHDPTDMDQLVQRTGLTPSRVSSMLLVMELEGRVAARHGRYHRVH